MYRFIFGILLVTHGLAHIFDLLAILKPVGERKGGKPRSSISMSTLTTLRSRATALFWLAAAWTLTGSGVGLFLQKDWWSTVAVIGAMLSITAVVPWWNRTRRSARLGLIIDGVILVGLLGPLKDKVFELIG